MAHTKKVAMQQGRENALRETARKMLAKGLSVDMVAEFSDLPLAEIKKLSDQV